MNKIDIKRIEKHGYKKTDFLNGKILKKIGKDCIFLKKKGKKYFCSIQKFKPDVCNEWPLEKYLGVKMIRLNLPACSAIKTLK